MTDKPKSLSEQLTELAKWLEALPDMECHSLTNLTNAKAAEVRAMAESVKGKVVSPVTVLPPDAIVPDRWEVRTWRRYANGATKEEATANLQTLLDEQGKE